MISEKEKKILRILDANINRLREGLRVIEEVTRMILNDPRLSIKLKNIRHSIEPMLEDISHETLLEARDSASDVFREKDYKLESSKADAQDVLSASFKRSQEAARNIEEFSRILENSVSEQAKGIRFRLYDLEKEFFGKHSRSKKLEILNEGFYAIIDFEILDESDPVDFLKRIADEGCRVFQYRDKVSTDALCCKMAEKLVKAAKEFGALLIINNRVDIAMAVSADGIHLGRDDLPVDVVRYIGGDEFLIGVSVIDTKMAEQAEKDGADYLIAGAVFSTSMKEVDVIGSEGLKNICNSVNLPVIGVGGINKHNLMGVLKAGTAGIAVITGLYGHKDVSGFVREMITDICRLKEKK